MKNIYNMLNDVEVNLDEYEVEGFNDMEKKRLKNGFKKLNNRKSNHKKIIAAASVAVLAVGLLGTDLGVYATETIREVTYNIASAFNIDKDIQEYTTVVNQSVSKNGIKVTLNEVILNDDELIVSTTIRSDEKLDETGYVSLSDYIYINGKILQTGSSGSSSKIDDYTVEEVITHRLDDDTLSGDTDIKIKYTNVKLHDKNIRGPWAFEFKTNGDELKIATDIISLDTEFTLEDGQTIKLEQYNSNKIGQKIYFTKDIEGTDYDMKLQGVDDLGNEVEFFVKSCDKSSGVFKIETINGGLNENATKLILTPYAVKYPEQSGQMSNDYKQVGEEFTIDLAK